MKIGMYATSLGGRMGAFLAELDSAGIPYEVGGMSSRAIPRNFLWAERQKWYREFTSREKGLVCLMDAWDMQLLGTREELEAKLSPHKALISSEWNLWPRADLRDKGPWSPDGPFPNGGGIGGDAEFLHSLLLKGEQDSFKVWEESESNVPYFDRKLDKEMRSDQYFWQRLMMQGAEIDLDSESKIWQCLFSGESWRPARKPHPKFRIFAVDLKPPTLAVKEGRWTNRFNQTPVFFHANGRAHLPPSPACVTLRPSTTRL